MGFYEDDEDYYADNSRTYTTERKRKKILNDPTKHYPNKDEASLLRKIMASTGLGEKEIREDKKYRKMLSDAQKTGQKAKRTEVEKFYQDLIKEACKKTGLAPQHPDTLKALQEVIEYRRGRSWGRRFFLMQNIQSAEKIVKQYAK